MLLRDQHPEEALLLHEIPDLLGDLALAGADLPVVDHPAELLGGPIEESLLLRGQEDRRDVAKPVPIRSAGEQFRIEPDCAGVERLLFRLRNLRKAAPNGVIGGFNDEGAAHLRNRENCQCDGWEPRHEAPEGETGWLVAEKSGLPGEREGCNDPSPGGQARPPHGQPKHRRNGDENEDYSRHQLRLSSVPVRKTYRPNAATQSDVNGMRKDRLNDPRFRSGKPPAPASGEYKWDCFSMRA